MISQQDRESSPPVDRPSVRPLKVSERLQGERGVILEHDSQDDRLRNHGQRQAHSHQMRVRLRSGRLAAGPG